MVIYVSVKYRKQKGTERLIPGRGPLNNIPGNRICSHSAPPTWSTKQDLPHTPPNWS